MFDSQLPENGTTANPKTLCVLKIPQTVGGIKHNYHAMHQPLSQICTESLPYELASKIYHSSITKIPLWFVHLLDHFQNCMKAYYHSLSMYIHMHVTLSLQNRFC
jgi:hypothetical protein